MWMLCFECRSYSDHIRISPSCDIKQIKEYKKCDKMSVQNSLHPFFGFWFTALNIWHFGTIYMNKHHWRHMKRRIVHLKETLKYYSQIHCRSGFLKWFSLHSSQCLPPNSGWHGQCPVTWICHSTFIQSLTISIYCRRSFIILCFLFEIKTTLKWTHKHTRLFFWGERSSRVTASHPKW